MKLRLLLVTGIASFILSCKSPQTLNRTSIPPNSATITQLLQQHPQHFQQILSKPGEFRVQIIYTQIDRKKNNRPVFTDHYFNVDPAMYFYPASTVKMPTALFALERIKELADKGITRNSSMITEAAYSGQSPVYNDPTAPDGRPTVEHYIKKIFLVSDNDAYNRLYEFVGQERINKRLQEMGYTNSSILHRLEIFLSEDENRHTNPVRFYDDTTKLLYEQPMQFNQQPYPVRKDSLGRGYYSGGKLINGPMDFSKKNKVTLPDLHLMLRSILFPREVKKKHRFKIADEDYEFLWQYMAMYPQEAGSPPYDTSYHDAYCKFLYWGSEKGTLPKNMRIFNKIGDAYGFLTDVAYVVDFENNIEFMVSATIYCNTDGILNDSKYDYDTIGFPFMKQLGRVLYEHELRRARKNKPDLSQYQFKFAGNQ
ncbi:MAG TPA: serine hydrolase [Chitinophagaceae bacterium]|nr:serine hydrolase [Chitinophagaceae bacterium]